MRRQGKSLVWNKDDDKITTWGLGSFEANLLLLLRRIEIEQEQAARDSPLEDDNERAQAANSEARKPEQQTLRSIDCLPNFADIERWIVGEVDDDRIETIARGLALLKPTKSLQPTKAEPHGLPMAYKVLKLAQHRQLPDQELPRVPGLLSKLQGDRLEEALADAARRMRASNLRPRVDPENVDRWIGDVDAHRVGAALAFPLTETQIETLLKEVVITDNEEKS